MENSGRNFCNKYPGISTKIKITTFRYQIHEKRAHLYPYRELVDCHMFHVQHSHSIYFASFDRPVVTIIRVHEFSHNSHETEPVCLLILRPVSPGEQVEHRNLLECRLLYAGSRFSLKILIRVGKKIQLHFLRKI